MREIVLDTETTGLDPATGDRIIEVGCVELINHIPTDRTLHFYANPERPNSPESIAITGLTDAFLAKQSVFAEKVDALLEFIGDDMLVIHNAAFDLKFLNAEFSALGFPMLAPSRALDTIKLSLQMFPGQQASLDALCKRLGVDNSNRTFHGALLDAQLLAECYLEMRGGRQSSLDMRVTGSKEERGELKRSFREPRPHAATDAEQKAHQEFLKNITQPIWLKESA